MSNSSSRCTCTSQTIIISHYVCRVPVIVRIGICETDDWLAFRTSFYCFSTSIKTFADANFECTAMTAHLASIHDKAEQDFIAGKSANNASRHCDARSVANPFKLHSSCSLFRGTLNGP